MTGNEKNGVAHLGERSYGGTDLPTVRKIHRAMLVM